MWRIKAGKRFMPQKCVFNDPLRGGERHIDLSVLPATPAIVVGSSSPRLPVPLRTGAFSSADDLVLPSLVSRCDKLYRKFSRSVQICFIIYLSRASFQKDVSIFQNLNPLYISRIFFLQNHTFSRPFSKLVHYKRFR